MSNINNNDHNTINNIESKKQHLDLDSETHENSKQENILDQRNTINTNLFKKSIDFFPKKMNIEELEEKEYRKRKYTLQKNLKVKNFVPQLKPIKVYMIPSKLRLNKKGFKDLKRNKNNKLLLDAKKYFISCPNLEDEESDKNNSSKDIFFYSEKLSGLSSSNNKELGGDGNNTKENINITRCILEKIKKKNIPKVNSKINNNSLKNKYKNEYHLAYSSESDLYDIDEINNNSILDNKNENKNEIIEDEKNNKGRNRFNSVSILDVLQKHYKLENE